MLFFCLQLLDFFQTRPARPSRAGAGGDGVAGTNISVGADAPESAEAFHGQILSILQWDFLVLAGFLFNIFVSLFAGGGRVRRSAFRGQVF